MVLAIFAHEARLARVPGERLPSYWAIVGICVWQVGSMTWEHVGCVCQSECPSLLNTCSVETLSQLCTGGSERVSGEVAML